ncbi:hypothetical protein AB6Q56_06370 [Dechloromonas sp. ARDL1]|uniref:hypothetical protein n=1 Tax=Dechloromonas sp. ARDL1 TaxID=3322121 RepID=UPI003DA70DE8
MADGSVADPQIRSPGGRRLPVLPLPEIIQVVGHLPSEKLLATATVLVDQLRTMQSGFLFSLQGRAFSRSLLTILEYYNPSNDELQDLIPILARFDCVHAFFDQATPENDDGLKRYLLNHGVLWEQVLYYHQFSAWTPVRFTGGFLLGLGYSGAAIAETLYELFDFALEACQDLSVARRKIGQLIDGIRQLSVESLAAMAQDAWQAWNVEFSAALYDLDFDKAGFMLGKLAGDLWFLFTGIRAIAKLPGMTYRAARRFARLFVRGARASKEVAGLVLELLAKLGSTLNKAVEVGFSGLLNFLDDSAAMLKAIQEGAVATVNKFGDLVLFLNDMGPEMALAGNLPSSFALFGEVEGTTTVLARVRAAGKLTLEEIGKTLESFAQKARGKGRLTRAGLSEIRRLEKFMADFLENWRQTLINALEYDADVQVVISRKEFGIWLHDHMKLTLDTLEKELKTFKTLSEMSIKSIAGEMMIPAEMQKVADTTILDFLKSRKDLWPLLGVEKKKDLAKLIKALGYTDPATATIGSMKCDGVLYDWFTGKLYSFDWTSGLSRYQFVQMFATADRAELAKLMTEFMAHAQREYVLRQAVLAEIFKGWSTAAVEVLYRPLPQRFLP